MDSQTPKYICIHGHFYQPPRENPWLEAVEVQDSAYPYHDWNQRITAECYAPNTASRILGQDSKIVDIVSNYAKISFNFGPTLLSWLQKKEPNIYEAILQADRDSMLRFSGHGSAMAQIYNHIIMPLADSADKRTQIIWGIRDFESRFGRKPEGMWLSETAVDLESLDLLAEYGIKFTILAPRQAHQIRRIAASGPWRDVSGDRVDTRQPYLCRLSSGRSIHLFFYDAAIAKEVAFGGLLSNGDNFAKRLLSALGDDCRLPPFVHLATDGETYGHHFKRADMALAYCTYAIETKQQAELAIYGEYLEKYPATYEVRIFENTSWSCEHGIERWRGDCGCNTGKGWRQPWRAPLREALNWLRDQLKSCFEEEMGRYAVDPWQARNAYIEVVLNRSDENVERFFSGHMKRELTRDEKNLALRLLEMQRNAMLMFTSCGWFFDEISGIETTQVLAYAARAMQLSERFQGGNLEPEFMQRLEKAPSNIPDFGDGARIYAKMIKPMRIDLYSVLAHYAVSSVFTEQPERAPIYCYTAETLASERQEIGRIKFLTGLTRIRSDITWNRKEIGFAVLHLGDFHINGGANEFQDQASFDLMRQQITEAFVGNDIPSVLRLMDSHFRTHEFSLSNLFKDEQRKITQKILSSTLEGIEGSFRQVYDTNYPIMTLMRTMHHPLPKILAMTAEFILNRDLIQLLEKEEINMDELQKISEEIKRWPIEIDHASLAIIAKDCILRHIRRLEANPFDIPLWVQAEALIRIIKSFGIPVELWETQNIYFEIAKTRILDMVEKAKGKDPTAIAWTKQIRRLGEDLGVRVI